MSQYGLGLYGLDAFGGSVAPPVSPTVAPMRATNSVLNLVSPPIDDMVLLHGTADDVTIGAHVPAPIFASQIVDTELASPLVGAQFGRLTEVVLGTGLALSGNILHVVFP